MMRANRRSEESASQADGFLEDAGKYGQSVGDIWSKNSTSHFCIHISNGVSEPWVMVFYRGFKKKLTAISSTVNERV